MRPRDGENKTKTKYAKDMREKAITSMQGLQHGDLGRNDTRKKGREDTDSKKKNCKRKNVRKNVSR